MVSVGAAHGSAGESAALPYFSADAAESSRRFASVAQAAAELPQVTPDVRAISAMVGGSGPLAGRTLFAEIKRLETGQYWQQTAGGYAVAENLSWAHTEPQTSDSSGLLQTLREHFGTLVNSGPLISLLSGGWDSRLLLALALEADPGSIVQAYTTSSDTGTILEELVASQVATTVNVPHEIVPAERDQFAADLEFFASAVDYLTSFHIWLVPIARRIRHDFPRGNTATAPTVLDGLGGGLFVGASFADTGEGSAFDARMAAVTKYLDGPIAILAPAARRTMVRHLQEDAEPYIHKFLHHPHGHILTAFLTRTGPGISLAPHGLIASVAEVATPFATPEIMAEGLRIDPSAHVGDRLYAELLESINPALARIPTAQEQVPWPRPHPRRIGSIEAIRSLRELILNSPVASLLDPEFHNSGPTQWRRALETTSGQHLLRGLATLALWLQQYESRLPDFDASEWLG